MRVLHVCPLWYPVAQDSSGTTERFAAGLIAELGRLGCQNTVLASGDSRAAAELIPVVDINLVEKTRSSRIWQHQYELHGLMSAIELAPRFDVVHSHLYYSGYLLGALPRIGGRVLHTRHQPVTNDFEWLVRRNPKLALSTPSERAADKLRSNGARDCRAIAPGVDFERLALHPEASTGLVFIGELSHDNGADIAVRVALETGLALTLAGPVPRAEQALFDTAIRPSLSDRVRHLERVDHQQATELLATAICNLAPTRSHESFPLAIVEAMACGTPTVALATDALKDFFDDETYACLPGDEPELARLVDRAHQLDRSRVRAEARRRFDLRDAATQYLERYEELSSETVAGMSNRVTQTTPRAMSWRSRDRERRRSGGDSISVLHLSPLWSPVNSDGHGGIETLLPALIAALGRLGCRSTLVASGDSRSEAELIPAVPRNLVDEIAGGSASEYEPYAVHAVSLAIGLADRVDVIHSHLPYGLALSAIQGLGERVLHTLHELVTADFPWFVARHPDARLVSLSEFQARGLARAGATRCRVIPNGIEVDAFAFGARPRPELAFVGAMEWRKGPDIAARVAQRTGLPITLAGPTASSFFERQVRPLLNDRIRYVGAVGHLAKSELLGSAACALMPSRWEEPFGLVAIEAMACGTPVVALASGALPEIVQDGVNGYLAASEDEMAPLVDRAMQLDRRRIRASVASRFDIANVARSYLDLYREAARG